LLLGEDLTERRLLEAQLVQAQKLESIGQLAAGIAHELNTPIQYIGDNTIFLRDAFRDLSQVLDASHRLVEMVQTETVESPPLQELERAVTQADLPYLRDEIPKAISESLEGVERVAHIVRAMKEFSHPGTEEKTAVDINHAIANTITVARNEWKYVAEVVADYDPALPLVPCLPGEFNQAILNLIVNAAHAIADQVDRGASAKGTITITTRGGGDHVEIRVRDTGTGIPVDIRGKVFDPFFTTKALGKGTGQGLAITHAVVVKKHGGTITFETEVGNGTTFILRLPLGLGQCS
jgi:signal transduction histidine kinase